MTCGSQQDAAELAEKKICPTEWDALGWQKCPPQRADCFLPSLPGEKCGQAQFA
jgi:hypothetical protein